VTLFVVDLLPLFVASVRGWKISRCDVRKHTSDPSATVPSSPYLMTNNYKIPTTNNVTNDNWALEWVTDDQRRSALADQRLHLFSRERAQAMLGESGVQRAREIVGRINQSAVEIEKKPASLSGLLPGVGEQSLDELVFE
jgi:hypothetical protein